MQSLPVSPLAQLCGTWQSLEIRASLHLRKQQWSFDTILSLKKKKMVQTQYFVFNTHAAVTALEAKCMWLFNFMHASWSIFYHIIIFSRAKILKLIHIKLQNNLVVESSEARCLAHRPRAHNLLPRSDQTQEK